MELFRRRTHRGTTPPTVTMEVPSIPPARHSPELERERVDNLLEVSRLVYKESPEIGQLALRQALEIGAEHHLPMDEILVGIPSQRP